MKIQFLRLFTAFLLMASAQTFGQNLILMQKNKLTGYEDNPCYVNFSAKATYSSITTSGAAIEIRDKDFNKIWNYAGPSNGGAGKGIFSPDEKYLIFSKFQSKGDVAVLRMSDKKVIQQIKAHEDYVSDLAISPDGKFLATSGNDSKVKLYQLKNEQFVLLQTISVQISEQAYSEYANSLKFSPDSKFLVFGGRMGTARYDTQNNFLDGKPSVIQVFNLQGNEFKLLQSLPERFDIEEIAFHPRGQYFVAATSERLLSFKLSNGKFTADRSFTDADYLASLSFNADGKYLAATRLNTFKVWEWKNGSITLVNENEMSRSSLIDTEFSPDGNYLVTTSVEKTVTFWEMPDAPIAKIPTNTNKGDNSKPEPKKNEPKKTEKDELEGFVPAGNGKNFLLVIGINSYKFWNPLTNAQKDAQDVKKVLTARYTFETANVFELYNENATSKNILAKISEVRQKVTPNDNLLIYFSGHGFYNAAIEEGFWIPVDAQKGQETEYLPNSTLLKYIKSIPAKHIFLVADACFSGSLIASSNRGFVENVEQFKSRRCLTSGYLEFVSDGNAGSNSPFAAYFIKFLKENTKKKVPSSELEQFVKTSVGNNSEQTPVANALKNSGDEGGEFVFYLR